MHSLNLVSLSRHIVLSKLKVEQVHHCRTMLATSSSNIITMMRDIVLFLLFLSFDGAHCPNLWCSLSKEIMDLGNDLLLRDDWNSNDLHSPHANKSNKPSLLHSHVPLTLVLPAEDVSHLDTCGRVDARIVTLLLLTFCSRIGGD